VAADLILNRRQTNRNKWQWKTALKTSTLALWYAGSNFTPRSKTGLSLVLFCPKTGFNGIFSIADAQQRRGYRNREKKQKQKSP